MTLLHWRQTIITFQKFSTGLIQTSLAGQNKLTASTIYINKQLFSVQQPDSKNQVRHLQGTQNRIKKEKAAPKMGLLS